MVFCLMNAEARSKWPSPAVDGEAADAHWERAICDTPFGVLQIGWGPRALRAQVVGLNVSELRRAECENNWKKYAVAR